MTCAYCNNYPRNPCTSRREASGCGNNDNPGSCIDITAREVAAWIRYNALGNEELESAADLIEREL